MARPVGFEPTTYRLEGGCSDPLSYGRLQYLRPLLPLPSPSRPLAGRSCWRLGSHFSTSARFPSTWPSRSEIRPLRSTQFCFPVYARTTRRLCSGDGRPALATYATRAPLAAAQCTRGSMPAGKCRRPEASSRRGTAIRSLSTYLPRMQQLPFFAPLKPKEPSLELLADI